MTLQSEALDNRELAIVIWVGVCLIWALLNARIRKSVVGVVEALGQWAVLVPIIAMLLYVSMMIYGLSRINLWDVSNLGETMFWIMGVGFVMLLNIERTKEDGYFRKILTDSVKLVVFMEFLTNLYVFSLWVELILVPIMFGIGALWAVASIDARHKEVESCLTKLIGLIGIAFIVYALASILVDLKGFASYENLREFLVPLILTVALVPFIYLIAVIFAYDELFRRVGFWVKNPELTTYARRRMVLSFHLNLSALNRWRTSTGIPRFASREEIDRALAKARAGEL